jgi:hypothetical protein
LASALGSLGATGGAGTTGVSIGITTMPFSITRGITRPAGRFITATRSIAAEAPAALLTLAEERSLSPATGAPLVAMPSLAARAVFVPMPSAASAVAERNGVFPRAEAPASAVAAFTAEADATERSQLGIKVLLLPHI